MEAYRYDETSGTYVGNETPEGIFVYMDPGVWVLVPWHFRFRSGGWVWKSKDIAMVIQTRIKGVNRPVSMPYFNCEILRKVEPEELTEEAAQELVWNGFNEGEVHVDSGAHIASFACLEHIIDDPANYQVMHKDCSFSPA